MNKIAASLFLITPLMTVACNDDNTTLLIIDTDGDGIADNLQNPPAGTLQWNATLNNTDAATTVTGNAVVRQVQGANIFTAGIVIRTDTPDAVRPWHVHFGTCATGGDIVGADADYARLTIASDGAALSTARVGVALDPALPYHVNVHFSDVEFNRIIACGDLILQ